MELLMIFFFFFFYIFNLMFISMLFMLYLFLLKESLFIIEMVILSFQIIELKLYFYLDMFSLMFMLIVSLISMVIFLFSKSYMEGEKNSLYFLILTFFFIASMFMVIMGMNMWLILWGWDGLGVVSYLLVIFYFSENSNYCGLITLMTNRLGDVGMILSIYFLLNLGSFDIFLFSFESYIFNFFFLMVILGVLTKSAQFPFSAWLPLAMAAPTPISALVHSSTLVTAGVYLLIRLNMLKNNFENFIYNLFILSLITVFISGLCALYEMDMKKVIALSTLSQLSLMFLIVLVGSELLGFYHILTHALFKALLFMCSGVFIHEFMDNQDIRNYKFVLLINPLVVSMFFICNFSLMGIPFLSGFYSKDLILEFIYTTNLNFLIFMMIFISMIFTSLYSLRLMKFSLLMTSKGMLNVYIKNWDIMYCSLSLVILGVFFFGSVLNWIFLIKLEVMVMELSIKMLNLFLIIFGFFFFFFDFKLNYKLKMMFYFNNLIYLTSLQGAILNFFMNKFIFFFHCSEFFLMKMFIFEMNNFLVKIINMIIFFKLILFYMVFLILFFFLFL